MSQYHETVLVVEDDPQIRTFIGYALRAEGFACITAGSANDAVRKLLAEHVDMMLLDLGLPDLDGMEVIRKVREFSELPIIVVSARDQDREKAQALDSGADDYLTKPFSATELLARVRVALRHFYRQGGAKVQPVLEIGELSMDIEKHQAFLKGEPIHLTPMEYDMLALFLKNPGKVLTTGYLIGQIWGASYGNDTQALRALMAGLRRKIEENPAKPVYIRTEIGVGYRLEEDFGLPKFR